MDAAPAADYTANLTAVKARIHAAEASCGRAGAGVRLLVATKFWGPDAVAAVVRAGGTLVGESRMQELDEKGPALEAAGARVHVIGQLQRNKAATAVRYAHCVQTVDSRQGAVMRMFGLASITVTTASAAGPITIDCLDDAVAREVVARLTAITAATEGDAT